jgi:hypothetical protein
VKRPRLSRLKVNPGADGLDAVVSDRAYQSNPATERRSLTLAVAGVYPNQH